MMRTTSSMASSAMSRPSTRCARSCALRSRKRERRVTTSTRWARKTCEQLLEPERARLAVHERDVVDAEALLERREPVQLAEHGLRVEPGLDLDDQVGAELAVGEVLEVGDALQLLGGDELLDLGDDPLRADAVRQLGDGDRALAAGQRADLGGRPHAHHAAPGLVRRPHLAHAEQLAAGRQVGPGHEAHQVVEVGLAGAASRWRAASTTSTRLCGIMLVAMPTAMPLAPLTSRLGNAAGSTDGWVRLPS